MKGRRAALPATPPGGGDTERGDEPRRELADELVRLRKAVEASGEVVFLTDRRGTITYVNPEFVRLYGYETSEVVGLATPRILKSGRSDRRHYEGLWRALLGKHVVRGEFVNRTKDGRLVTVESSANPITDERGEIIGFLAIQRDVTERKRADARLRESEERYRTLAEAAHDHIFIIGRDHRFEYVNQAAAGAFARAAEEIAGKRIEDLFPPAVADRLRPRVDEVLDGSEPLYSEDPVVFPGREALLGTWLVPIKDAAGRVTSVLGVARDISERQRLERQLLQSQKMEAIGRLAGGIAHDFNNLLSVILGHGSLLLDRLDPASPLRKGAEEIRKAGERAAVLTRQLLAFSRRQILEPRIIDMNAMVAGTENMLRRLIGEDVELHMDLAPELGRVRADPGQIEQVIVNLAVNARDAMPEGGTIRMETADDTFPEAQPRGETVMPAGPYVLLSVGDTGCGMDREIQARIFEPFFTTKPPGKGTGLGLSTVYGIVKQSGGFIWAESQPGRGTTFRIYLPRVQAGMADDAEAAAPAPLRGGSETVLIVEDDEGMRQVATRFLQSLGYNTLEAARPDEARRIEAEHAGPIHLLLADVVMPEMGGRGLADLLTSRRPGMQVLFMSGYTDDAVAERGIAQEQTFFLSKPFSREALGRKVREVLDSAIR